MWMAGIAKGFGKEKAGVDAYSGYANSAFKDQRNATGTYPFGLQTGYRVTPGLLVGFEAV